MTTPKAFFPRQMLPRLLFVFQEPFDKERARVDLRYDGEAKLTQEMLLYFYEVIYAQVFEMLDTLFTPYLSRRAKFIKPHAINIDDFRYFLHTLYLIQDHRLFRRLYCVDFSPFDPIEGDYQRIIDDWARLRGSYIDHHAKIKNLVRFKVPTPYPMPYRLARYMQAVKNNLEKYKEIQGFEASGLPITEFPSDYRWDISDSRVYHFGSLGSVSFNAKRSTKLSLFKIVVDQRGKPVRLHDICKKLSINMPNARQIVRDINKMVSRVPHIQLQLDGKANAQVVISGSKPTTETL